MGYELMVSGYWKLLLSKMKKFSAEKIFTGKEVLEKSVVITDDAGKILAIDSIDSHDKTSIEFFEGALCPGFVNAHCHLELSYMRNRIARGTGLVQFIKNLLSIRNEKIEIVLQEIENANEEMIHNGIVAVGDISNDDHSLLTKSKSSIYYHTFVEAYGFRPENVEQYFDVAKKVFHHAREKELSTSITPHAPYSVTPDLMKMIYDWKENLPEIFSIHNQETEAETQFFKDGTGDFKTLIDDFFKLNSAEVFQSTGKRSVDYLLQFIPKEKNVLLVHNTFTTESEMKNISDEFANLFWCACPKANLYIENRLPDYNNWLLVKDKVCIGTDSLASNNVLSILDEMKTIQSEFSNIKTETLLSWATINGAKFLQIDESFGSIEVGKTPGLNLISDLNEDNSLNQKSSVKKII